MEEKEDIEFNALDNTTFTVRLNERKFPSEVAREVVKNAIKPFLELESLGVIKGLRIILYGGTVEKFSPPNDYDILMLYDEVQKLDENKRNNLDKRSRHLYDLIFDWKEEPIDFAYQIKQYESPGQLSENSVPFASTTEVWFKQKREFVKHLDEPEYEKLKRSFDKLMYLPEYIYSSYVPPDEILNSEPYVDWDKIDKAALFCVILAKTLGYTPEPYQLNVLWKRTKKLKALVGEVMRDETYYALDHYIDRNKDDILTANEFELLDGNYSRDRNSAISNFIERYLKTVSFDRLGKSRVRWLFQSMARRMNTEETIVNSGLLIYGDDVSTNRGQLFRRDEEFLGNIQQMQ